MWARRVIRSVWLVECARGRGCGPGARVMESDLAMICLDLLVRIFVVQVLLLDVEDGSSCTDDESCFVLLFKDLDGDVTLRYTSCVVK